MFANTNVVSPLRSSLNLRLHSLSISLTTKPPLFSFLSYSKRPISFQPISLTTKPTKPISSSSSSSSSPLQEPITDLPPKLQEIVTLFQATSDPRAKYQQLLFYANKLPPLDPIHKTKDNKVEGCVSQVWVRAYFDDNDSNSVLYQADSDSAMTKGLAALLVMGLSGQPVDDIVKVKPDFVTLLGLQQNLTPSRNNGFLNMLRLMQRKALFLSLEGERERNGGVIEGESNDHEAVSDVGFAGESVNGSVSVESFDLDGGGEGGGESNRESDSESGVLGKRGERIRQVLERELSPVELEIEDISYQHAGHAGVRGSGDDGETHFNVKVVSNEFEGKSLVKRHRMVYALLQDELQSGLHALSIVAKTPSEVQA